MNRPLAPGRTAALSLVALGIAWTSGFADDPPASPMVPMATTPPPAPVIPQISVPADPKKAITFGPVGCPVMLVGNTVWDVRSNRKVKDLPGLKPDLAVRAISADGKWVAAGNKSPSLPETTVAVWSVDSGKQTFTIPGKSNEYLDLLQVIQNKFLVLGGRHGGDVAIWDVTAGKQTKVLTTPEKRVDPGKIAFSPDGQFFVLASHDKIGVCETGTGKVIGLLAAPGSPIFAPLDPKNPKASAKPIRPGSGSRSADVAQASASVRAVQFSPNGEEIAAMINHPIPRVLIWNVKSGRLMMDDPLPTVKAVSTDDALDWLPDRSGLFAAGVLFDRTTRKALLRVKPPSDSLTSPRLLDGNRIAASLGNGTKLESVPIPWDKLKASLAKATDRSAALLTPAEPVSVEVTVPGIKGEEARKQLTEALVGRLNREGILVADRQRATIRLSLAESAGDALSIDERQSPFDRKGKDGGRLITGAKGAASVEVITAGLGDSVWRGFLEAGSATSFREEFVEVTSRKAALENIVRQLNELPIPFFIPKNTQMVSLPAVIQ